MNQLSLQLARACSGLWVECDTLYDPSYPSVLSLPKLKMLQVKPGNRPKIVQKYCLPALNELRYPSVSLLEALPSKNAIKKLHFHAPTQEIIEIIADYTELESLEFLDEAAT